MVIGFHCSLEWGKNRAEIETLSNSVINKEISTDREGYGRAV